MPRLTLLLLTLGLLVTPTPAGNGIPQFAADLLSSDSSWEYDPNGLPTSAEESPDSGWEMDPDG
ncbi:MAG TPA: hypothetical protein VN493_02605 [Thermoanaerobaculia bacterium]|nr:hypothetical protein [Thermoanaerobaculia bacterium]